MSSALQSGNLSGAQSTFALLQQDAPQLAAQSQNAQTANPRAQAMAALGSALKSGDLSKAQQAFASLQQAMQGVFLHLDSQVVLVSGDRRGDQCLAVGQAADGSGM